MQNRHALAPSLTCGFCSCRVTFATCCAVSGHKPWKAFHEKSQWNYSFFSSINNFGEKWPLVDIDELYQQWGFRARNSPTQIARVMRTPGNEVCFSLFWDPKCFGPAKKTQEQLPITSLGCSHTPDKGCFGPHRRSSKLCVCLDTLQTLRCTERQLFVGSTGKVLFRKHVLDGNVLSTHLDNNVFSNWSGISFVIPISLNMRLLRGFVTPKVVRQKQ